MFSCEFCEISKSTFSYRTHAVAASGKVVIQSRTCGYVELSEVRPSYPEYPTLNIGTNWRPASYKILLRLERINKCNEPKWPWRFYAEWRKSNLPIERKAFIESRPGRTW